MHVSAERIAIADRAIRQTVEQVGVAWAAIPRWDTGDPGQVLVRSDATSAHATPDDLAAPFASGPLALVTEHVRFRMTLAQATSPTPDALLAAVATRAATLAELIDSRVLGDLAGPEGPAAGYRPLDATGTPTVLLGGLLDGRESLEDAGYRAASCLVAGRTFYRALNQTVDRVAVDDLLAAANVNSLHRSSQLDPGRMLMLGRRQQIAHGGAGSATPGEEPVDIAVAVPPSLEVVGESAGGDIELLVRVRFATRVKDAHGIVVFRHDA